jgi:outer membrane murein-binding lipoprotein Lpp
MDLYFQGLTRDEIAKKTGVSAGGVSGVIKEFIDCTDSTSTEEAAEEYDVVETVESLRSLAVKIRKAGTSVEELMEVSNMLARIKKLIELDRLEGFIKAGESLGDKAHVEASVRMHLIEERTGRSHDDILSDLESKETRVKELSSEVQRLQSQIKNLDLEREKAQTNLNAEKTRLEAELKERLEQHSLTIEKIEYIANIERELIGYGIELTQLEGLRRVLNAVEETGQDAKRLVELAKKVGSLRAQTEAEAKELDDTRELAAKLSKTISTLEERLAGADLVMEKCLELESMGWDRESLEKAILLAREAGSPKEALSRLELLKPSVEAKAELERIKAETVALKEETLKLIKQTLKTFQRWQRSRLAW